MTAASGVTRLAELLLVPPTERIAWMRARGIDSPDLDRLADEAERLCFSDVRAALEATEAIVALADALETRRGRALRSFAQALAYAGRHDEALVQSSRAAELAAGEGDPIEAARANLIALHPLNELGRHDEAIKIGNAARDALLALGEARLAARADFNLGGIHQNRDDPIAALRHFDRAAPAFADDPLITGYLENNRGEALLLLSEFDAAEQAFSRALAACDEAKADVAAAIAEGNLADLFARRGSLSSALMLFERARRRFEKNNASSHLARLQAEQAEAIGALGLESEALAAYESLLPTLAGLGLASEVTRARLSIGRLLLRLGRSSEAERTLQSAADELRRTGQQRGCAVVQVLLAEIALRAGDSVRAEALIKSAEPELRSRPVDRAMLGAVCGLLFAARGNHRAAREQLDAAIEVVVTLGIAPLLADLYVARADAVYDSGEPARALDDYRRAVAEVERLRSTLQADRMRAAFLGERVSAYEGLVRSLLDQGERVCEPDEIFETIELAKSRGLSETVRGMVAFELDPRANDDSGDPLRVEQRRVAAELNALYCRLADATHSDHDLANWSAWTAAVRSQQQTLAQLDTRIGSLAQIRVTDCTLKLTDVRRLLSPGDAIVEYFCARGEWLALVIRSDGVHTFRRLSRDDEMTELVDRVRFHIGRAARPGAATGYRGERLLVETRAALCDAYRILWQPLESALANAIRVVVVPHGPLHALPFHAIWTGSCHLVESTTFGYSPSASVFATLAKSSECTPLGKSALVAGVSDAAAPKIAAEALAVSSTLNVVPLLDTAATSESVRAALPSCDLAHLACHATFSRVLPGASGLRLADGWLTVRDISQLQLHARLVTLSGCSTARTATSRGDELSGLIQPFLSGGVNSVIASLWAAQDQSTYDLMDGLYGGLRGRSRDAFAIADQLGHAQRRALHRNPHPFFWAPFIVVGNP